MDEKEKVEEFWDGTLKKIDLKENLLSIAMDQFKYGGMEDQFQCERCDGWFSRNRIHSNEECELEKTRRVVDG